MVLSLQQVHCVTFSGERFVFGENAANHCRSED